MVPWMIVPLRSLAYENDLEWARRYTILELNRHRLVRAFHQKPTMGKRVSQELRAGALKRERELSLRHRQANVGG
jgi:hypothetical protein